MNRLFPVLLTAIVIAASVSLADSPGSRPRSAAPNNSPDPRLPVGLWSIEFSNGVVESCDVTRRGAAVVSEPARKASGHATPTVGAVLITFEDDRIERWTPVGERYVVEHWFPGSQFPPAAPVLGIAERRE
jgi:hypothetical protein